MKKIILALGLVSIVACNRVYSQNKTVKKELVITVDSAHAQYLLILWQAGTNFKYDELMKTNTPASIVNDFRLWADSIFMYNVSIYNGWFPKQKKDSVNKKP